MPAPGAQDAKRGRLLQGFFWGGVGLATLAMLVLLFSQSVVVLRVAVILCVVAIMMLAISIVLRPSVEMVRVDIEEHIIGEVERVRMRARDDISTAARNTHRVLSEKIHVLTATVDALRAQIEELKVSAMLGGAAAGPHMGPASTAAGVVHRTETVQVTRRTTTVDPGDDATRGTVYGSRSAVDGEWSEDRDDDRGTRSRVAESDRSSRPAEDGYGEADWEATFQSLSRRQSALPASPGRPASWYTGAEDEPSRSRGRDRESRHDREREPDRGRHSEPDYGRHSDWYADRDRERDREYDPERRHDREREARHDREREARHDREREARHDREREARHDRERDHDRRRDHDGYRDEPHDRYRDRGSDRYRDDDRGRHQRHDDRDRDVDRDYDRERASERDRDDRGHGRTRERDRGYEGDSDAYGRGYDRPSDRHLPRPRSPYASER
jgi:hypothetical protein